MYLKKGALLYELDSTEKQSDQYGSANYLFYGILQELKNLQLTSNKGFHLHSSSNLLPADGLNLSAALELATALRVLQLAKKEVHGDEIIFLYQEANKSSCGCPAGFSTKGYVHSEKKNSLVKIDCKVE